MVIGQLEGILQELKEVAKELREVGKPPGVSSHPCAGHGSCWPQMRVPVPIPLPVPPASRARLGGAEPAQHQQPISPRRDLGWHSPADEQ